MGFLNNSFEYTKDTLRQVFGKDREEREKAFSPSVEAQKHLPANITAMWGREDVSGLLSVSQNIVDMYADYEAMLEYPTIRCISSDTKVLTLEDGWITIKELADRGKDFHVISYDTERKALVPAKAQNARKSASQGHNKPMVRVHFDNSNSITCTADHRFMKKDESWIEAGDLKPGDRLMPGEARVSPLSETTSSLYWEIHQPSSDSKVRSSDKKRWVWTHRLVAEEFFGNISGLIVHHKDENSLNNSPDNLSLETPESHGLNHGHKPGVNTFPEWTEEKRIIRSRQSALARAKKMSRQQVKGTGDVISGEHKKKIGRANRSKLTKEQIVNALKTTSSVRKACRSLGVGYTAFKSAMNRFEVNLYEVLEDNLQKSQNTYETDGPNTDGSNHRVLKVEILNERPDVYDLEVPKYHNFVANGVVIHNCFAGNSLVYVMEGSLLKPVEIEKIAFEDASVEILAYDHKQAKLVKVTALNPRLTGLNEPVIKIRLSNKSHLRVTKNHKILHREKGYVNADTLVAGDELVSPSSGFNPNGAAILTHHSPGYVTVLENPVEDGSCRVFDITTKTHNLIVNGVVCHNSAMRYYANDATQPDIDTGRTIWVTGQDDSIVSMSNTLIHKKLRMEDEIWSLAFNLASFGNCLPASSRIWLKDSIQPICNIVEGDEVVVYSEGNLTTAKVKKFISNGIKKVFEVKTKHRTIRATAEHPFLKDTKGNKEWCKLQDLNVGDSITIATTMPSGKEPFELSNLVSKVSGDAYVKLTAEGILLLDSAKNTWKQQDFRAKLLKELKLPYVFGHIRRGVYGVKLNVLKEMFNKLNLNLYENHWEVSGGRGNQGCSDLTLPERITPEFCRLYGYALADGSISASSKSHQLSLACGNKPEHAKFYFELLKKFTPRAKQYIYENGFNVVAVASIKFVELFKKLGWTNGAHIKRVPDWIWGLPEEYREALLEGFADGDGCEFKEQAWHSPRIQIELCNYELVKDLKDLADGLGFRSGNIYFRERFGVASYNADGKPIYAGKSWSFGYNKAKINRPIDIDKIKSIEEIGEEEVYDLTIDHDEHNFIADGVVVHNCMEEILIDKVGRTGVVGFNSLPPQTVRRIEASDGSVMGYIQDITGKFTQDGKDLRLAMANKTDLPAHVAVFEDWEICHMRLRETKRRAVYGMCIPADGLVWTTKGPIPINEVKIGDRVQVRHSGMLRTALVSNTMSNGVKQVYKLKTAHREIRATDNHPFLVDRGGKNNVWIQLKDLKVGDKIIACSQQIATTNPPAFGIKYNLVTEDTFVRITERGINAIKKASPPRVNGGPSNQGTDSILYSLGFTDSEAEGILLGETKILLKDLRRILKTLGLDVFEGSYIIYKDVPESSIKLPDFVEPWVCRLFGFLLGDGWISDSQLFFARGIYPELNKKYEDLLRSFNVEVSIKPDNTTAYVSSRSLVKAFREIGWTDLAHFKRLPQWIFTAPEEFRKEMLAGFMDADGWTTNQHNKELNHIEICNHELLKDIKILIDGLGYTSGNIRVRAPRPGLIRAGLVTHHSGKTILEDKILNSTGSFLLSWNPKQLGEKGFSIEVIKSIEPDGQEEVFDITIDDNCHNFVCNGFVVHNSLTDAARWIWKRLILLEDSVMLFRLTKSPSRFAFYVDVGDEPPDKVEAILTKARDKLKKTSFINPKTGRFDSRYNPMCLTGDTKIPLLNGKEKTILELVEDFKNNKKNWTYSIDTTQNNKLVPGEIVWAGKTREKAQLVRVTLDNGEKIRCTPDHKFMLRTGEYQVAENLKSNTALMSNERWNFRNHKVVSVEFLTETEDTYCITVDKVHNFATSAGVIVKNSMQDDFIMALRDGKPMSKVESLSGPIYTNMDDIVHFKKMLYAALGVPKSYLGEDDMVPNKGMLSANDGYSSKTTLGLQRELRNGIARIIHVDLAAKGINPFKVPFTVNMTVPSNIYELTAREVQNARADVAQRMLPYVSLNWVRKNIFKLSDDQIELIEKEAKEDQEKQLDIQMKGQKAMMDMQMQAQQGMAGGQPGGQSGGEAPETPTPGMHPGSSDLPRTTLDWKRFDIKKQDANNRLEELRERKTRERLSELEDKFDQFMRKDSLFRKTIQDKQMFLDDVKNINAPYNPEKFGSTERFSK